MCYGKATCEVQLGRFCKPSRFCRLCKEEVQEKDFTIYTTYRRSLYTTCHKECLQELQKKEAYECQNIDTCCNDCIFFQRLSGKHWRCTRLDKDVLSGEGIALSSECKWTLFKHRKDGVITTW